jgi:glycosyltransferase involved in cell wall biosynthesis
MALAVLLYMLINGMHSLVSVANVFSGSPSPPPARTTIAVCCYNEPDELLSASLSSLANQDVVKLYPDMFELLMVTSGGCSERLAQLYGFKVVEAPRGKLVSRDMATRIASGDIIVSADSDTFYPPAWLSKVLEPFRDPSVVGVTVPSIDIGAPLREMFLGLWKHVVYSSKMLGRGSAYRKWAYFSAGGFNLDVDRLYLGTGDIYLLVEEEEINFKKKLEKIGRVVYVNAPVIHMGSAGIRGLRSRTAENNNSSKRYKPARL